MAVGLAFAPAGVTVGEAPPPGPPEPPLAGGYAWYIASELEGSDGDRLAAWPDGVGSADLSQTTEANKPQLKLAVQNGLNVVRFTRTDTETMLSTSGTLNQPFTILAAVNVTSSATNKAIIQGDGDNAGITVDASDELNVYAGSGFTDPGAMAGSWRIVLGKFNGGSSSACRGDGVVTTGGAGAGALFNYSLGSAGTLGVNWYDGDIGELFIHPTALSDADINTAATEMKTRWNATWTNI